MKNTYPKNRTDSSKNNRKLRVFLLFLVLSFLFWMLIKLSKDYISDVEFDLVYTEVPKNKLIQNNPNSKIVLTIKTVGFKLFKYSLSNKELNYSLDELKRRRGTEYFSLTKSNINLLQAQFSAETEVLKAKPDTLFFDLGIEKTKKIKIIPHVDLQFKPGFNLIKKYVVDPEYITISGPAKLIDSVSEIHTELLDLKDLTSSFDQNIALIKTMDSVSFSSNSVNIKGMVEKITEGSFTLPYKVINLPKNSIISTYPKEVKVVYQVALKDYNKITENSFDIQCDYRETTKNNLDYLTPILIEKPSILFEVKIVPNKIEFLIKK